MLTFEVPIARIRMGNQVSMAASGTPVASGTLSPVAKSLVLGHRIVQEIETGDVAGVREMARRMGVSHAWVSALVALTLLSPRLQTGLLLGTDEPLGFHTYLKLARHEDWGTQETLAEQAWTAERLWGQTSRIGNTDLPLAPESRPTASRRGRVSGSQASEVKDASSQRRSREKQATGQSS